MAILNAVVGLTQDTVFTSSGSTAITFMSLCNVTNDAVTIDLFLVPSGDIVSDACTVFKELALTAGETYEFYHAGEKLILADGDRIVVSSTAAASIAVVISSVGV